MIGISIACYPYEEPYHLNLRIKASNGRVAGDLEYYCNASDLKELGKQLIDYLGKPDDEIHFELGSEAPEVRCAFYLSLRVKPLDSSGHSALFVHLNNNEVGRDNETSRFSIKANRGEINRLGKPLSGFGDLQHLRLDWHVHDGRLIADD
jgi:hypothetical protein